MTYTASPSRNDTMTYNRCGHSGLKLPAITLGLWQNFGGVDDPENSQTLLRRAFDLGITHFDLANNYGPPPGSAEETFGRVLHQDFSAHRDELIISTKAGYLMWPGPYGDWGSRKYLVASLDQSLRRMKLDYVDIFYSHRPDPETPLEETMAALNHVVRQGKALYVGISSYSPDQTRAASAVLRDMGTPCLIHQPRYSMFSREPEGGLLDTLSEEGIGCIAFCPLAKGLLTNRYLHGIPADSRIAKPTGTLQSDQLTPQRLDQIRRLNAIAESRGQSLAQMALQWVLRDKRVTSALIGASRISQLEENVKSIAYPKLTPEELAQIDYILK